MSLLTCQRMGICTESNATIPIHPGEFSNEQIYASHHNYENRITQFVRSRAPRHLQQCSYEIQGNRRYLGCAPSAESQEQGMI